jgi:hypothetical protein
MNHYRCQNVYIAATASERIVDTLEFFRHNFPMPQLSSTDILIMEAKDMSNALKNPHPEVPFSHIGDDTIAALTKLAEIFKKFKLKDFQMKDFQMHLPRPLNTQSPPNYPIQSWPLPCTNSAKQDHKR